MTTDFSKVLNDTRVRFEGDQLEIDNGTIMRRWRLTDAGLVTTHLNSVASGRNWCHPNAVLDCDWELPGSKEATCNGQLVSIDADLADDEGFTSEHVLVRCRFHYEQQNIDLDYLVWVYPGFAGMRVQHQVKRSALPETNGEGKHQGRELPRRIDFLPISTQGLTRTYLGYNSDTQNRNDALLDILREQTAKHSLRAPEWNTWGSAVCLEDYNHGLAVVKESHKCVNRTGHDTGMFMVCPERGLINTGWGIHAQEINLDVPVTSWGNWLFCWNKGEMDRETAFKQFDRLRYPIHLDRDAIVQANTWGSTQTTFDARNAANEASVMQEIATCAELGIDVIQIDDGWQVENSNATWQPDEQAGWRPHPDKYPQGWAPIVAEAKAKGVKLGLWAAAEPIPFEDLVYNREEAGFVQFKLDFANLQSREQIDALMGKARKFIKHANHEVKVNWDLTEIQPRYGYFFAREYGSIYLENRKPVFPFHAIYRPASVLRDLWHLSRYVNLNKFQCSYQNIDMVTPELSNAGYHTHAYCLAITLMGTPLFFLETKHLSDAAKQELRPVLKAYKQVQREMFSGYVYPIGAPPNDASWTGFQNHNFSTGKGFITIFRELNNDDSTAKLSLRHLPAGTDLKLTNLMTGEESNRCLDQEQQLEFTIDETPGFLFLRYEQ